MLDLKKIETIISKGKINIFDSLVWLFLGALMLTVLFVVLNRYVLASKLVEISFYLLSLVVAQYLVTIRSGGQ